MVKLWREVRQLVVSWWQVDRVRVSPAVGRLLRLQPPCLIIVQGQPAEVLSRTLVQDCSGSCVLYDCRAVSGAGRLRVGLGLEGSTSDVSWWFEGSERPVLADDVETFLRLAE